MVNVRHFSPKPTPIFPLDPEVFTLDDRQETPTPTRSRSQTLRPTSSDEDDDEDSDRSTSKEPSVPREINKAPLLNGREELQLSTIEGWKVDFKDDARRFNVADEEKRVMDVAMGLDGQIIVGVGTKSSVWVWKNKTGR